MEKVAFTQKKFLALPLERRHKKLSLILRALFDYTLQGNKEKAQDLLVYFNQLSLWNQSSTLEVASLEAIADSFHEHLRLSKTCIKEENYLDFENQQDRQEPSRSNWDIDIYLDKIRSTHNIGSIFRTCEAMRLGRICSEDNFIDFEHPQIKKTAMGSWDWVEYLKVASLSELKRPVIALEISECATPIYDYIFPPSFTLILGNEEYGVSKRLLEEADEVIYIPMAGRKNSLNVANAFAVVAGEIVRQRLR
ncbi:MAG: TrmH family RNA methyltransferase [Chlamydiales bacterium]|nr:hypothetical protein [Chlamydiales bacterium]NCF70228.1 TrmH family RNA methyltransferase [Chlamydiales bacterium]